MPFTPRLRLPRRRQPTLCFESIEHECHEWYVYTPDPDQPLVVHDFADAAMLALEVGDLPAKQEVLVLLDEHRRITAMLLDAPGEIGLFVGHCAPPGTEAPFCQTICIELQPYLEPGPPSEADRRGYFALRRAHMAQGLLLMDVLLTDGESVRSLAIGCDQDPVWFDPLFEPDVDPAA